MIQIYDFEKTIKKMNNLKEEVKKDEKIDKTKQFKTLINYINYLETESLAQDKDFMSVIRAKSNMLLHIKEYTEINDFLKDLLQALIGDLL